MLKLKAFWLQRLRVGFVSFSSTPELLLAIKPVGISVANPVE
jgi:hypothetical protein